jgi:CubicO group peptidase (beta-lactamase class C family)
MLQISNLSNAVAEGRGVRKFLASLVAVLLLAGCVQSDPVAQAGFCAERLQRVDSLMAGYVRDGVIPNFVSFVARNGQVVHHKAYGYKDAEAGIPASVTDIFRIASQTKAITTAVLLSLWEENYFYLDDPLEKYLPVFANPQVYVSGSAREGNLVTRPATRSITIRHLLTHTAGYSYNAWDQDLRVINYPQPVTTREVVERIARTPLNHDPGEAFSYGFSLDIAGHLAEVLTGKTLDTLMKERIFDPLGMHDTHFFLPPEKHDRLVKLYRRPTDNEPYSLEPDTLEQRYPLAANQPYLGGGAGLCGTIEDYAKFCLMILNGGAFNGRRILGRKTVELMATNQLIHAKADEPFGLGFAIVTPEEYLTNLSSPGSLRWGGAYDTKYLIDRKENMVILMYTNMRVFANPMVYNRYLTAIYQALNTEQ